MFDPKTDHQATSFKIKNVFPFPTNSHHPFLDLKSNKMKV